MLCGTIEVVGYSMVF